MSELDRQQFLDRAQKLGVSVEEFDIKVAEFIKKGQSASFAFRSATNSIRGGQRAAKTVSQFTGFLVGMSELTDMIANMAAKAQAEYKRNKMQAIMQGFTDKTGVPLDYRKNASKERAGKPLIDSMGNPLTHEYRRKLVFVAKGPEGWKPTIMNLQGKTAQNIQAFPFYRFATFEARQSLRAKSNVDGAYNLTPIPDTVFQTVQDYKVDNLDEIVRRATKPIRLSEVRSWLNSHIDPQTKRVKDVVWVEADVARILDNTPDNRGRVPVQFDDFDEPLEIPFKGRLVQGIPINFPESGRVIWGGVPFQFTPRGSNNEPTPEPGLDGNFTIVQSDVLAVYPLQEYASQVQTKLDRPTIEQEVVLKWV